MEKKRTYQLWSLCLLLIALTACTKSETRTKRFLNQDRWMMTSLSNGSNQVTLLPKWDITSEPQDKEFANATWTHYNGSTCQFNWRFDYYSGTFTFNPDESITQDEAAKAFIQCKNLSGTYTVLTDKRKLFEFESYETYGYPGIRVYIKLEPL